MEVKIGVAESPRELVVASDQSPDEVQGLVDEALANYQEAIDLRDPLLISRAANVVVVAQANRRAARRVREGTPAS